MHNVSTKSPTDPHNVDAASTSELVLDLSPGYYQSQTLQPASFSPPSIDVISSSSRGNNTESGHTSSETRKSSMPCAANTKLASNTKQPVPNAPLSNEELRREYATEFNCWVREKAFIRVGRSSVPKDANIIGSHTIFSRKDNGRAKARIVPWGHRDIQRHDLRSDSPCVNLEVFRWILSLSADHVWALGKMDIRTAFLQAHGFDPDVFARPPKQSNDPSGL